jgi:GMP synthase-like glutamine amidotransferase
MSATEFQVIRHSTIDPYFNRLISGLDDYPVREIVFHPGKSLYDQLRRDRTGRVRGVVVFSGGGGKGLEVNDFIDGQPVYKEQMQMVTDPEVSVFGVCLGMQIGVAAFARQFENDPGPYVVPLEEPVEGPQEVQLFEQGLDVQVVQYGSRDFKVIKRPKRLQVLGISKDEAIQVVASYEHSYYGQQFHSERHPGTYPLAAYATRFARMDQLFRAT